MLELRDLCVNYGKHRALDAVSLNIAKGEIVVILGANGAGKSTLLRAVSGISAGHVEGHILLDGHSLAGMPAEQIVEAGIALVPEGRGIFADLTVRENLTLGAYAARARGDEATNLDRVMHLFPKLGERKSQIVRTMSGGEQQMVAIGRAMMSNPTILMLDEPSLGLSPLLCKELFAALSAVRQAGLGILLVEQNAKQSLAIADRGYLLENARIVHQDSAANLATDPKVQAAYLGVGTTAATKATKTRVDQSQKTPADITAEALAAFHGQNVAADPVPPIPQTRQKSTETRSAESVLGYSITDLVASAAAIGAQPVNARAKTTTDLTPLSHDERLRATLDTIERAARAARQGRAAARNRDSRSGKGA